MEKAKTETWRHGHLVLKSVDMQNINMALCAQMHPTLCGLYEICSIARVLKGSNLCGFKLGYIDRD